MSKVGVIGCGLMGKGMAKNLLKAGHEVSVYDTNPSVLKEMENMGAQPVEGIASLAADRTFLLTSLPSSEILEQVLLGASGAIQVMKKGTFILDMGTTDVMLTRSLHQQAGKKGISFFDCPVSGGPQGAEQGKLTIMVGGEHSNLNFVSPILEALGSEIVYIGDSGSGQIVKLCNNLMVAGIIALLSEVFLTGEKAGVPPSRLAEVLGKGSAQSKALHVFGPNLVNDEYENVLFQLNHMAKDTDLYIRLVEQGNAPSFVASVIQQLYNKTKILGKGGLDTTAVKQFLMELGTEREHNFNKEERLR
jgi:3-hydroxyisobutyrate dehydrogenase